MDLEEAVKEFGGKAGQLMVLREADSDLPMYRFVVKKDRQSFSTIKSALKDMTPPFIVRGSLPGDHFGLEGIIPSYHTLPPNNCLITTESDVETAINMLIENVKESKLLKEYEKLYGKVERKVNFLIMEWKRLKWLMLALRLPHNPDFVHVELVNDPTDDSGICYPIQYNLKRGSFCIMNATSEIDYFIQIPYSLLHAVKNFDSLFQQAIQIIMSVENSGKTSEGYANYYEIGFDQPGLLQVRPFVKKSSPKFDFDVSNFPYDRITWLCIGQTPKEGIELPYVDGPDHYYNSYVEKDSVRPGGRCTSFGDVGLMNMRKNADELPEADYKTLKAFIMSPWDSPRFLSHNVYRMIKRTGLALFGIDTPKDRGDIARIVCNGEKGAVYF